MSFPVYPSYRDSGVEWLGHIPADWSVSPVKRVIDFQTGWTPPTGKDELYGEGNTWITIGDLNGRIVQHSAKQVTDEAIRLVGISPSPKGSLLFSFKLSIGQVAFAGEDLYTNEAIATFLPSPDVDLGFAYYAFPVFIVQNANENIYGAKLLNQELIREAKLALPPLPQQTAIAAFLDRETAKIDALVEEQRRLIELLKEKRQAVVSHAVTRGLDPTVPMKDSGVEWLGEIPAHWDFGVAKHVSQIFVPQRNKPDLNTESCGVAWLTMEGMKAAEVWNADRWVSPEAASAAGARPVPTGAVVASCIGTFGVATINRVPVYINQQLQAFVCGPEIEPEFLRLIVEISIPYFDQVSTAATLRYVNQSAFAMMPIVWPSLSEQRQIIDNLATVISSIDALARQAIEAADLLKERRAALISSAVTGKINVTGVVPSCEQVEAA